MNTMTGCVQFHRLNISKGANASDELIFSMDGSGRVFESLCLFLQNYIWFHRFQEMYPPKVHQFAYVTDEACTEDEILSMEIIIMKVHTDARGFFLLDSFTSVCVLSKNQSFYWVFVPWSELKRKTKQLKLF